MNQALDIDFPNGIKLYIKREDLLCPYLSGNKFRKLKYNLLQAKAENYKTLLTFGGAYSNHIAAVANIGKQNGFKTIGIIRGEELVSKIDKNPTLKLAQQCGMKFKFIRRKDYQLKTNNEFIDRLEKEFGAFYNIPEGGTNLLAVQGCEEILTPQDSGFNYICCAIGTGGTISGLINSAFKNQKILGFPALKSNFIEEDLLKFVKKHNWEIIVDYHFGGYAKINTDLIQFINNFYNKNKIPLDPIYTGKMVFGIFDLIQKKYFPKNSKILIIHTGGIQGIEGMNQKLKNKKLPIINYHD